MEKNFDEYVAGSTQNIEQSVTPVGYFIDKT